MARTKHVILFSFDYFLSDELVYRLLAENIEVEFFEDLKVAPKDGPVKTHKTDLNAPKIFFPAQFFKNFEVVWFAPILWAHFHRYFGNDTEDDYIKKLNLVLKLCRSFVRFLLNSDRPKTVMFLGTYEIYDPHFSRKNFEAEPTGTTKIASLLKEIEEEIETLQHVGVRTLTIRSSEVLHYKHGFVSFLHTRFRTGVIPFHGDGKEWFPWIHYADYLNALLALSRNENYKGTFNLVSPSPNRFNELVDTFKRQYQLKSLNMSKSSLLQKEDKPLINQQLSSAQLGRLVKFQFTQFTKAWNDIIPLELQRPGVLCFYNAFWLSGNRHEWFNQVLEQKLFLRSLPLLKSISLKESPIEGPQKSARFLVQIKRLGGFKEMKLVFSEFDSDQTLYALAQQKGPFEFWNHQFRFIDLANSVLMLERFIIKVAQWELVGPIYKANEEQAWQAIDHRRTLFQKK
jgi:nucleoside-diphosphate-sugar epimerase